LRKELASDLPPLRLDPKALKHVFMTLMTQSLRAMSGGGELVVRTSARTLREGDPELSGRPNRWKAGDVLVAAQLEDSGAGRVENTFTAATDTELARRLVRPGSALELMVVRKIIELHGGTVEITNRPEGGARFTLQFKASGSSTL
jgi:signal transduction histidine kinase